ncbi:EAL domain-containing protein [Salmonella enterica]|nr:EAL domain-containing protein [Salmonella enterica]EGZ4395769.1 EAL domain-containing protein [Salmonella enterica subsp. enterica serovar Javiana]EBS7360707.1 EAL domain-containing protein [Salmonella enterica]EGF2968580.1 EAL domain-containing protein [Salmonella enterica]EGP6847165.1 EAL domain-containing protein [Salmonella enterica]
MNKNKKPPTLVRQYVEAGFVVPYFQPVVDIRRGLCCGAEVLARVIHPERGLLLPADFILPETDEDALTLLTRTLMQQAGSCLPGMPVGQVFMLSFNITPAQLTAPWLPGTCDALRRMTGTGLTVVLELTEQRPLSGVTEDLRARLALLRRAGVRLALDDFGTGFSGLSLLLQTGGDILKIPREFVAAMGKLPRADQIVDTILELANRLGMEVIAEGVEQRCQAERLVSRGVRLCQGAFYSMPLAPDAFADWLSGAHGEAISPRMMPPGRTCSVRKAVMECARRHVLTLRETEVLVQLARGRPLFEQARQTNRSTKTCSVQKRSAYRKIGVGNDVEFMHYLYSLMTVPSEKSGRHVIRMADNELRRIIIRPE